MKSVLDYTTLIDDAITRWRHFGINLDETRVWRPCANSQAIPVCKQSVLLELVSIFP